MNKLTRLILLMLLFSLVLIAVLIVTFYPVCGQ